MSSPLSQRAGQRSPSNSSTETDHHQQQQQQAQQQQSHAPAPVPGTSRGGPSPSSQPSTATTTTDSNSWLRKSSGRPQLHLQPPGSDGDDPGFFQGLTAPRQPNAPTEVALHRSRVAQAQDLSTTALSVARDSADAPDNWWTFTLPAEAIRKVDRYWHSRNNSESVHGQDSKAETGDSEKPRDSNAAAPPSSSMNPSFSARISGGFGPSATSTPWMAPWTPFRAPSGQYDRGGFQDPDTLHEQARTHPDKYKKTLWGRIQNFFLFSAFAPFWCRFTNLAFTVTVLGLAVKIYLLQRSAGFDGLIGLSTVLILVIGPLSVVHIFGALFFEYFGAPVGVASVSTKMMYTLLDLLFVALWSAILAITFDDYYTSNAQCTSWTPYGEWRGTTPFNPNDVPDTVCDLQLSLLVLNFFSVILYQGVLIISLFRIFKKVSRPSG